MLQDVMKKEGERLKISTKHFIGTKKRLKQERIMHNTKCKDKVYGIVTDGGLMNVR